MPAKDEKENGDEVEHNVVEWEEGIWQVSRRTTECQRRGKWGATIQERDAGRPFLQGDSRGWGTIDYSNTTSFDRSDCL